MSYNEQLQKIFSQYENSGNPTPASLREVAAWAIDQALWRPRTIDIIDVLAEDLGQALREEYRTDRKGKAIPSQTCCSHYPWGAAAYALGGYGSIIPRSHANGFSAATTKHRG
jgi:hypothetical protein